jgi:hypothetical protein
MSCVCILTPVVIAAWPAFSAAVTAAAVSLGYSVMADADEVQSEATPVSKRINLEIAQSEIVTGTLGRDQRIRVVRDDITVTFARDPRGRASVCVSGEGHSEEELRALGEELSGRVVQQYVHQRLKQELAARGMNIVEEETNEQNAIRIKVRHWQN